MDGKQVLTTGDSQNSNNPVRLGTLELVNPREVWKREDTDFTPWLLENSAELEKALGIEVELTKNEHPVGAYSLDVIGKDRSNGVTLIVENQLASSDHTHLGQLLTYAAGTQASTVVWITTQFRDEHRQALQWLNEHTDETTYFFGIELEVVKIGDSDPAPLLKVVAQPSDWGKAVKASASGQQSAWAEAYRAFWTKYLEKLRQKHPNWTRATPVKGSYIWMHGSQKGIGHVSVFSSGGIVRQDFLIDCPTIDESHAIFRSLERDKDRIERDFGESLEWDSLDSRKLCRISATRDGDISKEDEYDDYIRFFIEAGERFRRAISDHYLAPIVEKARASQFET